jgi:phosphate-selective porin OprO/OprP
MKTFRLTALASVINLTLAGAPALSHAATHDNYTEALERRVRELEKRLEKLDHAGTVNNTATTENPEVEKLTRKVKTLERKLEVQDEVAGGNFQKLPKFEAGSAGFRISSSDEKHQVRIRAAGQADGRFFSEDSAYLSTDRFELKQARIWVEGRLWEKLYFKIMPDFAASNILPDAYLDYAYLPAAGLGVGKMKSPLSLERLQGDSDTTFMERAYPTYLASNRDVGIELHGEFGRPGYPAEYDGPVTGGFKNFFSYQVGVFNGTGDDGSPDKNSPDTDDDKEFVGRVWLQPFQHSGYSWLEGLGIGVAGTVSDPVAQALRPQATPLGRTVYLDYANTYVRTPATGSSSAVNFSAPVSEGDQYRIYPQAYWFGGPFGLIGEYVVSSQHLLGNTQTGQRQYVKQDNTAWQIQASYVLTGEDNSFAGVKPIQPFNPFEGKWGALQLAARWSELDVDDSTFTLLRPDKSPTHTRAWTIGLNWFLNNNALIRADYEQVQFDGGAGTLTNIQDRPTEQVFATRFQLVY